jgi:hypothetical protein
MMKWKSGTIFKNHWVRVPTVRYSFARPSTTSRTRKRLCGSVQASRVLSRRKCRTQPPR